MVKTRKSKKRMIIGWGVFLVILVIVGVVCVVVRGRLREEGHDSGNVEAPVVQVVDKSGEDVVEIVEPEVVEPEAPEDKKVVQYEGVDPNTEAELTGVVTYAGLVDDKLMIRVSIDQYLNGGSCELKLTRFDEVVYSASAAIVSSVSSSTCEGFDVPVGSLAGPSYGIEVYLSANGKIGVIRGEVNE